jgi:hypothetical protein
MINDMYVDYSVLRAAELYYSLLGADNGITITSMLNMPRTFLCC